MTGTNPFNTFLVWPMLNVLFGLYYLLSFLHIPSTLGFAIILLTIVIRVILYPLTASQLKTTAKMQKLTPHLNKLKEKHKNDAKMLQSETMKLYSEHGVNPAAGCLPVVLQLPLIWGLYSVLQHVVTTKQALLVSEINKIVYFPFLRLHGGIDQFFFGLPLGKAPSGLISTAGIVVFLVPLLTGVFQFVQSKMMLSKPDDKKNLPVTLDNKKEEKKGDDFASAMQAQSLYIFPIMIGFFSWTLPFGLSLYWNTFTIFGILQQYQIQGWGGLTPWIEKLKRK